MLNLITNDRVTQAYGDRNDGIYVYKGDRRIGFITDLKAKLLKELKAQTSDSGFRALFWSPGLQPLLMRKILWICN